ncbi:MAG: peptidase M23 [Gammaproteobacteria bacterium]|nr:peptidase M23 [Gammaproteobacteria bacterium]|tara:strand:+ start:1548 stop:2864 length:1317 start_codon:yes stop_codon:yes gene_type:complete
MLKQLLENFIQIYSRFPKKHGYSIVIGFLLLIIIGILSNIKVDTSPQKNALSSTIPLEFLISKEESIQESDSAYKTRTALIKRNDTLFSILKRLDVEDGNIINLINSPNSRLLSQIKIGKSLEIRTNDSNEIITLKYINDFKSGVVAKRREDDYEITKYVLATEKTKIYKNVTINNSLYVDGLKENIPDSVIMDLVYIFGWDIDFVHDIRPGDTYSLIYEEVLVNGEKKLNGDILIAEFINNNKKYTAIRYKLKNGKSEYFSPEGRNVKKAFLRSPVKFSYISSKYNLKRRHPILHKIRAHTGVDYAAAKGTPIRATGNGTIIYAGPKGGYGNLLEIKHTEDYSTRYAHLNRFQNSIKVGKKVKQSDIIGFVGKTGTATGYHLHYEFRVNGKHTNPLTVKLPNADPIEKSERNLFQIYTKRIVSELKNFQVLNPLPTS